MASNDLRLDLAIDTRKAQQGLRETAKEAKKLGTDLEDTRSAGKKVADELKRMADTAATELTQSKAAVDKLTSALGDELVAEAKQAGGSVEGLVADLRRLGLTYEEIEADAEALADSIRHSSQVSKQFGDDLNASAMRASQGLDRVRASGDQTGSVMANLVGNSVQDLGALGGVAGTAGMALGQLAEYATEGNISLGSLAKFAGPMIGVGLAVTGISLAFKAMQDKAKKAAEDVKRARKELEALADGDYEGFIQSFVDQWPESIKLVESLGYKVGDLNEAFDGSNTILDDVNSRIEANNRELSTNLTLTFEQKQALQEQNIELSNLVNNIEDEREARGTANEEIQFSDRVTRDLNEALRDNGTIVTQTIGDLEDYERQQAKVEAATRATEAATKTLNETYDRLMGKFNQSDKLEQWREAIWALGDGAGDAAAEFEDWQKAAADVVMGIEEMPDEQKTKLLLQIEEGDKATVDQILWEYSRGVNVPVRFQGQGQVGFEKRATGGPVKAGEPYTVGEEGEELFVPNENGTIIPADITKRILGAAQKFRTKATTYLSSSSAGAPDTADNMGNRYETGDISLTDYRRYLTEKLGAYEKYSNEWMAIWRTLNNLAATEARAQEDAARAAQAQAKAAEDAAKKALADADARVRAAFEQAAAQKELNDAIAATDLAWQMMTSNAAQDPLNWAGKQDGLNRAFVDNLYRRADANANAGGIKDGSVEWARAVRASLENDKRNAPHLAAYIDSILAGIPQLANGGIIRKRPGGTLVNVGEGNTDEAVIPLKPGMNGVGTTNIYVNMPPGLSPRAVAQALRDFERYDAR